jgi:hypothetical protein
MRHIFESIYQKIAGYVSSLEGWKLASFYLDVLSRLHRFSVTREGCIGVYPMGTQPGNNICIILRSVAPFVVRKSDIREHHFGLEIECHIHIIMKREGFESKTFRAVDLFLWRGI